METKDQIKIGDRVVVSFNNSQVTLSRNATILAIPCATGDSWVFRDDETKLIHYVSEGCTISKRISA
jgi:hypothetical protein